MEDKLRLLPVLTCLFMAVLCAPGPAGGQGAVRATSRPMTPGALAGLRGFLGSPAGAALLASSPRLGGLEAVLTLDPASPKTLRLLGPLAAAMPAALEGKASGATLSKVLPAAIEKAERIAIADMNARWDSAPAPSGEAASPERGEMAEELAAYSFYGPGARMLAAHFAIKADSRRALLLAGETAGRLKPEAPRWEGVPLGRVVRHYMLEKRRAEAAAGAASLLPAAPGRPSSKEAENESRVELFRRSFEWPLSPIVLPRAEVAALRARPGVLAVALAEEGEAAEPRPLKVAVIYDSAAEASAVADPGRPRTLGGYAVLAVTKDAALKGDILFRNFHEASDPAAAGDARGRETSRLAELWLRIKSWAVARPKVDSAESLRHRAAILEARLRAISGVASVKVNERREMGFYTVSAKSGVRDFYVEFDSEQSYWNALRAGQVPLFGRLRGLFTKNYVIVSVRGRNPEEKPR